MFRRLRNKFILTNLLTTTAIIIVAFTSVFIANAISAKRPRPMPARMPGESSEMREVIDREIQNDRDERLGSLALTLVLTGISIELLVFLVSYFIAESAIKPVKEAYEKQRIFIANASHELKTPIAAVQANFEALGATEQPWVDNIENELNRASNLVSDLLTLARTDGRTAEAPKKDTDIAKVVRNRTQLIQARLGDKKLELELPEKAVINLNAADFTQVLDILLDNAVKYSEKKVVVRLDGKRLIVENDGKTIAKDKIDKIFDRFYQTDKTAEGSGLGLAIAKAIADQNKWNIQVESDKKLTRFSVSF